MQFSSATLVAGLAFVCLDLSCIMRNMSPATTRQKERRRHRNPAGNTRLTSHTSAAGVRRVGLERRHGRARPGCSAKRGVRRQVARAHLKRGRGVDQPGGVLVYTCPMRDAGPPLIPRAFGLDLQPATWACGWAYIYGHPGALRVALCREEPPPNLWALL